MIRNIYTTQMKTSNLLFSNTVIIGFALLIASCSNNPDSIKSSTDSSHPKWFGDCEGIPQNYGDSKVSNAAIKLLQEKVGRESSYRFFGGNVEVRGNCQFLVTVRATADIGAEEENLRVRIGWDGKEFYLMN